MNLLAKSCFCPGIISLLRNLIVSAGEIECENYSKEWMKEYADGMGHEIYRTDLSYKFEGKSFSDIASIIYDEYKGILFAIEFDLEGHTVININPGNYLIYNI